jgi:hypothetical protein
MATLLFRTDFKNQEAWRDLAAAMRRPSEDGFLPDLSIIEDQKLDGCTPDTLINGLSGNHSIIFVADSTTMAHQDRPILCVDVVSSHKPFRVIPSQLWSVENNLSLANLDYSDFAEGVDADGIFRGFP